MKKMLFVLLACIALNAAGQQTFNLDEKKAPKSPTELAANATVTKDKATYKGIAYPVYQTANGKFFIIVQSPATRNYYRKYFKK